MNSPAPADRAKSPVFGPVPGAAGGASWRWRLLCLGNDLLGGLVALAAAVVLSHPARVTGRRVSSGGSQMSSPSGRSSHQAALNDIATSALAGAGAWRC